MNKFKQVNKKYIIAAAAIAVVAIVCFLLLRKGGSEGEDIAYVSSVKSLTGRGALGAVNKLPGIVESQETWSVSRNSDVEVEELHVEVGQEVSAGDPLFTYSTAKYEEDLKQAQIDLERLNNELTSTQETLEQLRKDKNNASSSEQANYTIQIKEQELSLKEKEIDIQMKESEIEKLEGNIENATVVSAIDGVVKSINKGNTDSMGNDSSYITVMKVGDYRVKGTVSEQNIGQLTVDAPVLVFSRVDDRVWKGTISEIKTENEQSNSSTSYYEGDSSNRSSKYPFYVQLDTSEGLMLGQHVYVELDQGQYAGQEGKDDKGIWIDEYLIDFTDPDAPAVWKDVNGRLKKTPVEIGERNDDLGQVQVLSGLELTDSIAVPDETLRDGMKTELAEEMTSDEMLGDEAYDESGEAGEGGEAGMGEAAPAGADGDDFIDGTGAEDGSFEDFGGAEDGGLVEEIPADQ